MRVNPNVCILTEDWKGPFLTPNVIYFILGALGAKCLSIRGGPFRPRGPPYAYIDDSSGISSPANCHDPSRD